MVDDFALLIGGSVPCSGIWCDPTFNTTTIGSAVGPRGASVQPSSVPYPCVYASSQAATALTIQELSGDYTVKRYLLHTSIHR